MTIGDFFTMAAVIVAACLYTILLRHILRKNKNYCRGEQERKMKKSNIKRILSGLFAVLMVCCIAFTTQGLTVNAAIVSGGKKIIVIKN